MGSEARPDQSIGIPPETAYPRLPDPAPSGAFTLDEGGRITSADHVVERTIGRTRDALLGKHFAEAFAPAERAAMSRLFRATMRGNSMRARLRFRTASNAVRLGSFRTAPIIQAGRVTGVIGILRDVTDEAARTEKLLQREKLAAVGQLLSGVAHELNNPLAGILAFSQILLASCSEGTEQRDAAAAIHHEARRAARIVSNMLGFTRKHRPERAEIDVNRVLLDTLELRRYTLRTHQIDVTTALEPALPLIWGDQFQLQQVFLNLLINAEQALQAQQSEKHIVLRTRSAGDRVIASVSDSGPGMSEVVLGRIFDPFYTTKPEGEGAGLGLSLAASIVAQHGGRIRVRSAAGAGSTFLVELPVLRRPADREVARPRVREAGSARDGIAPRPNDPVP